MKSNPDRSLSATSAAAKEGSPLLAALLFPALRQWLQGAGLPRPTNYAGARAPLSVPSRSRRGQEGVTAVLMTLMLTGLTGMAAMAVDSGMIYTAQNSAQNAADAGALAGAYTFLDPSNAQPSTAVNAAIALANANTVLGSAIKITSSDVTVNQSGETVTVTVPRTGSSAIPTFFARVFGAKSVSLTVTATAQASGSGSGSSALRPLFVPNTILSSESPTQACADGQTILDSSGNLSSWFQANPGLMGQLQSLEPVDSSNSIGSHQCYAMDYSNGNNDMSTYACALSSRLPDCQITPTVVGCGSTYTITSGSIGQATYTGIGNLLGSSPDLFLGPSTYQHSDGSVTDSSLQLIVAPVWDDCCPSCNNGKGMVNILGFTNWFVQGQSQDNNSNTFVSANIVAAAGCNSSNLDAVENADLGVPVRLVTPSSN